MSNQPNKKYIVITSIFDVTEAIIAFSKMSDFQTVVVGDKKTPKGWACEGVEYLSVEKQEQLGGHLYKHLPYNHYTRKMLGYLWALEKDADIIVDSDDDNIPKENWLFPSFEGSFSYIPKDKGFINICQFFTDQPIWPRGLPPQYFSQKFDLETDLTQKSTKIGIWQGLADGDPDVDAIYRLTTGNASCVFNSRDPVVLGKNTITPINTQNTATIKALFPLLYLPVSVAFRYTDILRGLVAQPIMWLYGYHLGYTKANVFQKRNAHDYFQDFLEEIEMYQTSGLVVDIVSSVIQSSSSIQDNLLNAYAALHQHKIVGDSELKILEAWLMDCPST